MWVWGFLPPPTTGSCRWQMLRASGRLEAKAGLWVQAYFSLRTKVSTRRLGDLELATLNFSTYKAVIKPLQNWLQI